MSEREDKQFENLLYYLQQNRGFDFTGYKRPSLMRRWISGSGSLARCPMLIRVTAYWRWPRSETMK
jgi:hypothetical protein